MVMKQPRGWRATRARIYLRDGGVCWWCHKPVAWDDYDLDHLVERARGGGHEDYNLVTAHKGCNRGRSANVGRTHKVVMPYASPSRW